MAASSLTYSRAVAWLKIALPIMALGLLSTLFLLARDIDSSASIPFAKIDIEERAKTQQVTAPNFSGVTKTGDLIAFSADVAKPDPEISGRMYAEKVDARIDMTSGAQLTISAETAMIDTPSDRAVLSGGVTIITSSGYTLRTNELTTGIRTMSAESQGEVLAEGPVGTFTAGKMKITTNPGTKTSYLVFTNGVKLVYKPNN